MLAVRKLPADRLGVIAEIDRSEHIDTLYEVRGGVLTSRPVDIDVPRWTADGAGPHSIQGFLDWLAPVLERGATLLGAFDRDQLAGIAIVEERFEGDMAWLVLLHVSNPYRRHGVGTALWTEAVNRARSAGSDTMYVSATPSGSAVGFYLQRGCVLARPPHTGLLAKEPDDIHLVAAIG